MPTSPPCAGGNGWIFENRTGHAGEPKSRPVSLELGRPITDGQRRLYARGSGLRRRIIHLQLQSPPGAKLCRSRPAPQANERGDPRTVDDRPAAFGNDRRHTGAPEGTEIVSENPVPFDLYVSQVRLLF